MAERAHPDLPGFQNRVSLRWRLGIVPWITWKRSAYRAALKWRYRWAQPYCRGRDVLDVPCGMGWGTSMLRGCRSVTGLDRDQGAIEEARQRYGSLATFQVGDMTNIPFEDDRFDAVCCLEGIEHISREQGKSFLSESRRVLRERGLLFLSSPYSASGAHSGNPFHAHEYRPDEIAAALFQSGYKIEDSIERQVDKMRVLYLRCRG